MKPRKTECARCRQDVFIGDARIKMVNGSLQWVHADDELCTSVRV